MSNRFAISAGNYSDTSIWSTTSGGAGGASVPIGGDNAVLNAQAVVMDGASIACDKITSAGSTGGYGGNDGGSLTIALSTARTINANIEGGCGSNCLAVSGSTAGLIINGNLTYLGTTGTALTSTATGSGTITINGNVGGSANTTINSPTCAFAVSTATINGNVTGATAPGATATTGTLTINGTVTGGSANPGHGAAVAQGSTNTGLIIVNGSLVAGTSGLNAVNGKLQWNPIFPNSCTYKNSTGTATITFGAAGKSPFIRPGAI